MTIDMTIDGPERTLVYELALGSGLRALKIASLKAGSFDLRTRKMRR